MIYNTINSNTALNILQGNVKKIADSTLTSINRDHALTNRPELLAVSFPNVSTMGYDTFWNCTALSEVHMPALQALPSYTFQNCSALESISLPAASILSFAIVDNYLMLMLQMQRFLIRVYFTDVIA